MCIRDRCKGAKPYPIHTVEKCKSYNWLPLYPTPQLARLVGLSMGDGSIQATLAHTFFCSKSRGNLECLNDFIYKHFKIRGSINPAGLNKNEYLLEISNTGFTRLLYCAGCPKGEKTKQIFAVPYWIRYPEEYGCNKQESKEIQLAFLQGLNDSETTKLSLGSKGGLSEIKFEITTYVFPTQLTFIKQIKQLLLNFGIKSDIFHYWRSDKQNWRIGLRIKGLVNKTRFLTKVGFFFNKERLDISLKISREYIKKHLKNIKKYKSALKMIDEGKSYSYISKVLEVPVSTLWGWKNLNRKPLYFEEEMELKELINILGNNKNLWNSAYSVR